MGGRLQSAIVGRVVVVVAYKQSCSCLILPVDLCFFLQLQFYVH